MTLTATKILIEGTIEVETGLHIGGDTSYSAIGAIDSPVVRDPLSRTPIIPGSSLKGKMRSLMARKFREETGTEAKEGTAGFEADANEIKRLFGSSVDDSDAKGTGIQQSRLIFRDAFLTNKADLPQVYETKFENTIDRLTAVANPRQIERVIRGAKFGMNIIYNVEDPSQIEADFKNIEEAMKLLQHDYLGGGGTRGNGRIKFSDVKAKVVTGDTSVKVPEINLETSKPAGQ